MILHTCELASDFFIHIGEKNMILHIFGHANNFFENVHLLHHMESILQRTMKKTHIIYKKFIGKK
jgi:hypothetical protein